MTVDSKYPFKKIATVVVTTLGAIAAIISIYVFFVQEKKVELQYEILANTNVLDINAELTRLKITYNGISLKEQNENLRIINLRIINRGNLNILKEYLDDNDPIGFRISNGEIIEKPELIGASSQNLKDHLQVQIDSSGKVRLSKVLIDSGDYIVLKLLILHKSNKLPEIIPTGKVSGMGKILVVNLLEPKDKIPFFVQAFSGSLFVQIVRSIVYFLIIVIIIFIIALSTGGISDFITKHKRKRIVNEFKNLNTYSYNKMDDAIFERYIKKGLNQFKRMSELLEDADELNDEYRESVKRLKKKKGSTSSESSFLDDSSYFSEMDAFYVINRMMEDGMIFKVKEKILINQPMKSTLDNFLTFLKKKKEFE